MQVLFNPITSAQYWAGFSEDPALVDAAQALRWASFHAEGGDGRDSDAVDAHCKHLMVVDMTTGQLVGYTRIIVLHDAISLSHSYTGQFYDLLPVMALQGAALELGRFCLAPDCHDPRVVKLIWASLLSIADENGVGRMIGCSSFKGADPQLHVAGLTFLAAHHLGQPHERPGRRAPQIYPYGDALRGAPVDELKARRQLPPLLRSYLQMNGWVSDHAVIDNDLDTIHVFTNVEWRGVPPVRLQGLRQIIARGRTTIGTAALEGA
ncbi:acyl-CoA N-acyltransferase [Ketogulonicigenium robustum]|uniref:L-ornithine N(alpha)-acyltransferase n=1 Tax=Ketogulonicigenium robustum TaxID=92947 RepID=A0A1W6NZA6_9RHOB|nr:GNAT family N-acetyltransferase [Ketogulonicigenium robustum]ARO14534.1 acyl-CoA N-acyltransferase [Ketogulonicigenium robustum]